MAASKKHPKTRPKAKATGRAPPPFYNLKKQDIRGSPTISRLGAYKCNCRSMWCSKCFRNIHYPKIADYLMGFDYRHTVVVTCTFDPSKCVISGVPTEDSGKIPYQFLIDKSPISVFIGALKSRKVKGGRRLKILGYIAFLEFQKSGNPHYHLVIHFADDAFQEHDLQQSWKYGDLNIRMFSSEDEYWDMFPYLRKDPLRYPGESHQIRPPQDWLDNYPKINRILSSQNIRLGYDRRNRKRSQGDSHRSSGEKTKARRVYHKGLRKCGQETTLRVDLSNGESAWCKLPINYDDVTKLPGHYNENNAFEFDDPDRALKLLGSQKRLEKLDALASQRQRSKKK